MILKENVIKYLTLENLINIEAIKLQKWYANISNDQWMMQADCFFEGIEEDFLIYEIEYNSSCADSEGFTLPLQLLWMDINQRKKWYFDKEAKKKKEKDLKILEQEVNKVLEQKKMEKDERELYEKLKKKYEKKN